MCPNAPEVVPVWISCACSVATGPAPRQQGPHRCPPGREQAPDLTVGGRLSAAAGSAAAVDPAVPDVDVIAPEVVSATAVQETVPVMNHLLASPEGAAVSAVLVVAASTGTDAGAVAKLSGSAVDGVMVNAAELPRRSATGSELADFL